MTVTRGTMLMSADVVLLIIAAYVAVDSDDVDPHGVVLLSTKSVAVCRCAMAVAGPSPRKMADNVVH